MDTPCTSIQQGRKDTPSRPHCCWCKGKAPHVHTVGSKMDTVTPSHPPLFTVERVGIKTSHPQCCCIHPLVYIVDYGKGHTFTSTPADSAKGYTLMSALTIHPHVHTVECGNTSSRPYCWWWKSKYPYKYCKCWNAGKKVGPASAFLPVFNRIRPALPS